MTEITESDLEARQIREFEARYTDAEVEALGKKGEAFKNPDGHFSFPVANATDLSNAIQALGRAPAAVRDAVKAYIKSRASSLGATDKLPEAWRAADDEALEAREVAWDEEHRDGASFKDRHGALSAAIRDQPSGGSLSAYLIDFDDDTATYESGGKTFQAPYTDKGEGKVSVGKATEVKPVMSYVARAAVVPDPDAPTSDCTICNASGSVNGATCAVCGGSGKSPVEGARGTDEQFEWRKAVAEKLSDKDLRARHTVPADKLPEPMEIRETKDGDGWVLTGYPSVTETPYAIGSAYTEVVARGAFRRSLKNDPDVVLNLEHGQGGSGLPLARTKAGTLILEEHTRGLYMEAHLDPLDPDAQLLKRKMQNGSLDGQLSFAFRAIDQDWNDDFTERTLKQVEIAQGDVSVVVQGANPATSSSMRSLNSAIDEYVAKEQRAGRVLSSQNVDTLKEVLSLTANADENLDKIQPMLSRLLGVANPDKPDEGDANAKTEPDGSTAAPIVSAATDGRSALEGQDFTKRARQKLEAIERRDVRTMKRN
jgi:HK97 family phage prohead protease